MFSSCDFTVCVFCYFDHCFEWIIDCSSLCTFGSVYFCFFLITLKYVYLLMHLCFFVDPPPVNGILLFPLHVWVRLRF